MMRPVLGALLVMSLLTMITASDFVEDLEVDVGDEDDEERRPDISEDIRENPCMNHECERGEECDMDEEGRAICVCIKHCVVGNDERFQTCSSHNQTYPSPCHLDQDHCRCMKNQTGCQLGSRQKVQLDYFGPCIELSPCPEFEMTQFPGRTRDWLFNVMQELANHQNLGDYVQLLEEAKVDPLHSTAVLWKFCDLDKKPRDRFVTKRELLFIIRSLKSMEHCLVPFLNQCDADDDRKISLNEWGACLQLEDTKINDLCKDIKSKAGQN